MKVSAKSKDGERVFTKAMMYVSRSSKRVWLSERSLKNLGVIGADFPTAKALPDQQVGGLDEIAPCGCPSRSTPPNLPSELPFEAERENIDKMRWWMQERYAASVFNKCTHQPIPLITLDPVKIHITPGAKPVKARGTSSVPLHIREEVKKGLDQDVDMGILEKVPKGDPTKWLHPMHVVPKPDGTPHRTIDVRNHNKVCKREDYHVVSPYKQARSIPHHLSRQRQMHGTDTSVALWRRRSAL